MTVGASFARVARAREDPSSVRIFCEGAVLRPGPVPAPAPLVISFCWSMENSTVDSLNGPPAPESAKYGSDFAQADSLRIVGDEESSSAIALWSQAERMIIFMIIASRCKGMSDSSSSGS